MVRADVRHKDMNIKTHSLLIMGIAFLAGANTIIADTLEERLHKIVIPRIEFRNANPADVFSFIRDAVSVTSPEAAPSIGLIHVNTSRPRYRVRHIYGTEDGTPLHMPINITLNMRRVTLYEALRHITATMGIDFRVADDELLLYTRDGHRIVLLETIIEELPGVPEDSDSFWTTEPWRTNAADRPHDVENGNIVEPETAEE